MLPSLLIAASPTCPQETTPEALELRLEDAQQAFSDLDSAAFEAGVRDVQAMLPCMGAPLAPGVAAEVHQIMGLYHYAQGDEAAAQADFAAARSAGQPTLPQGLVPAGHDLHELYQAQPVQGASEPLPPADGTLLLDGRIQRERSLDRPTVAQLQLASGEVYRTDYLLPSQALPAYPAPVAVATGETGLNPPPALSPSPVFRRPALWLGSAGVTAALAGVSWTVAARNRQIWEADQPSWGESELRAQEQLTNRWAFGAAGLSVATVGLVGTSLVVAEW